uniref:Putative mediator of RNA polymerase II transcription subunit 15c n=2 Tax=Noccaea caerulescens TaxID=107243 RepID=A0A1J3IS48_NOCCA
MEGNSNWKPNEQGGESTGNNANDWRSKHEPDLRKKVLHVMIEKLKKLFPNHNPNDISEVAARVEDKVYGMATDKDEYLRKLAQKMQVIQEKIKNAQSNNEQSRSSLNGSNTADQAAQVVNQEQSLPTSLPYTQTPISQQWLPQNIQSNLNMPGSSGLPSQVPAQNANIQMGEGLHSELLPGGGSQSQIQGRQPQLLPQQQPQSYNYMYQQQVNQQLLKEKIRHGNMRPPYMQQQTQPQQQTQQHHHQSLLTQPIQQQLPNHQTPLSTLHHSFRPSSALSTLPSSSQQNSQFLPRPHFPTHRVQSSHQQQMAAPSKQQEQEQLINQLMNGPDTQQGAFRVSSSQQNNIASFQAMAQHNNNILQNVHQQQQRLSAFPSQQQQNMMNGVQSGNFNVPGSSLLGTQGQDVGQSQPMMLPQYQPQHPVQPQQQQPQNRSLQQQFDNTQRFQAAGSLHQTQNIADQQNQPYHLKRGPPANPSTSQDSTDKTVNASGGDWQEETYQKIKALKDMYLPIMTTLFNKITEKLQQIESLPPQNMLNEPTEKLRAGKTTLKHVIGFLNSPKNLVSENHRDMFSQYEEQILRLAKSTWTRRPMQQQQQQQGQFPQTTPLQSQSGQVHASQSLDNDQMASRLIPSHQQNMASSSSVSGLTTSQTAMPPHSLQTRPKMEPKHENNNTMASSGNVALPPLNHNPASNPQVLNSYMFQQKQFHHRQMPPQQQPLQRRQQLQIPTSHQTNEMNDARMRQRNINIKAGLLQKHLSSSQHQLPKPQASPPIFTPSASSPQIQKYSSPLLVNPQQILPATVNKTGTTPSPVTSFAPSPIPGDPEKLISVESPCSFGVAIKPTLDCPILGTQEQPSFTLPPEPIEERPIDRLIKAFQSSSPKSLAESVSEMNSVISLADRIAGSVHSNGGSRAGLAEDLSARTKHRLQQEETTDPNKRFKRMISTVPLEIASQTETYQQFSSLESEGDSTASSGSKVGKIEPGCALMQEINEINGRLVETLVDICGEDVNNPSEVTSGTIVTCSYTPVALCATFEALYKSGDVSQIQPLRVLVPENYPYVSPILIDYIPFDSSVHNNEDLSARTRSRFSLCMKEFSEPMSLKNIAHAWDDCARATMAEYAERHGGGTFSSKYGHWETGLKSS